MNPRIFSRFITCHLLDDRNLFWRIGHCALTINPTLVRPRVPEPHAANLGNRLSPYPDLLGRTVSDRMALCQIEFTNHATLLCCWNKFWFAPARLCLLIAANFLLASFLILSAPARTQPYLGTRPKWRFCRFAWRPDLFCRLSRWRSRKIFAFPFWRTFVARRPQTEVEVVCEHSTEKRFLA